MATSLFNSALISRNAGGLHHTGQNLQWVSKKSTSFSKSGNTAHSGQHEAPHTQKFSTTYFRQIGRSFFGPWNQLLNEWTLLKP